MKRIVSRNCSNCNVRIHKIPKNVWYICSVCNTSHPTEEGALECEKHSIPHVYPKGTEMVCTVNVNGKSVYVLSSTLNTPGIFGHGLQSAYILGMGYVYEYQAHAAVKLAELFKSQNITQLPENV